MSKYLYGASVQGIQEFIFATNELKTIIGASEIIKNLNEIVMNRYKKNIVINAAGNIKLVFDGSEKERLEELVLNFSKEVKKSAYGITFSQGVEVFETGGLKDAFETLEKKLHIQRNRAEIPLDMSINLMKLAAKSGKPAVEKEKDMSTLQKEAANTSRGNIPKNRKNKTAIIHADGNGLGAMIASMTKTLQTDDEVMETLKHFSHNLDTATVNAYNEAKKDMPEESIRDVILGGDDMTIICSANYALKFTNAFLNEFENQTRKLLGGEGLTACAGIAYCNHKYPFHYAVNLAESLCSYAKEHSKRIDRNLAPSSLMFHNIQSSNFSSFEEYIDKELTLSNTEETIYLNYGPYFIKEQENYSTIKSFMNLSGALKVKGSPATRLREWLTILGQDANQAKERLIRINSMMDMKQDIYRKDIYRKDILEKNLSQFNSNIRLDELIYKRDEKEYTPMGDINTHLSVVDWSK